MNARKFLDVIKNELNINTDEELSILLGASKSSLDKWIQRDKVPDKWKFIIKEKLLSESKQQTGNIKNHHYYHIVNSDIHINLSQFDHKRQ